MRIAVASEGLQISSAFENCSSFTCYKVESGVIVDCQNTPNLHVPLERLAPLFRELGVAVLITGSIEPEGEQVFQKTDIEVVINKSGTVRQAAEAYLAHTLFGDEEWNNVEANSISRQS